MSNNCESNALVGLGDSYFHNQLAKVITSFKEDFG